METLKLVTMKRAGRRRSQSGGKLIMLASIAGVLI